MTIIQQSPKQNNNFIKNLQIIPNRASNNPPMIFHFALNSAGITVLNNDTRSSTAPLATQGAVPLMRLISSSIVVLIRRPTA